MNTNVITLFIIVVTTVATNLQTEQHVEGEAESHDEDGEDTQRLQQGPQDLQEHHHVDAEKVKPARTEGINVETTC